MKKNVHVLEIDQQHINTVEEENSSLQMQLQNILEHEAELTAALEATEKSKNEIIERNEELLKEGDVMKRQLKEAGDRHIRAKELNEILEKSLAKSNERILEHEMTIAGLNEEIKSQAEMYEKEIKDGEKLSAQLRVESRSAKSMLQAALKETKLLKAQYAATSKQLKSTEAKLAAREEEVRF